jgi:hypothetical protein
MVGIVADPWASEELDPAALAEFGFCGAELVLDVVGPVTPALPALVVPAWVPELSPPALSLSPHATASRHRTQHAIFRDDRDIPVLGGAALGLRVSAETTFGYRLRAWVRTRASRRRRWLDSGKLRPLTAARCARCDWLRWCSWRRRVGGSSSAWYAWDAQVFVSGNVPRWHSGGKAKLTIEDDTVLERGAAD